MEFFPLPSGASPARLSIWVKTGQADMMSIWTVDGGVNRCYLASRRYSDLANYATRIRDRCRGRLPTHPHHFKLTIGIKIAAHFQENLEH